MTEPFEMVFAKRCHELERENALLKLGVNELLSKQVMELSVENACLRKANGDLRERIETADKMVADLSASLTLLKSKRKWGRTYKPKSISTKSTTVKGRLR